MHMKAIIKAENYKSGKCLSIYVNNKETVNSLMLELMEAGFIVNYEPRCVQDGYEGCVLCSEENAIKVCCKG